MNNMIDLNQIFKQNMAIGFPYIYNYTGEEDIADITENNVSLIGKIISELEKPNGQNILVYGVPHSGKKHLMKNVLNKYKLNNPKKQIIVFDFPDKLDDSSGKLGSLFFNIMKDIVKYSLQSDYIKTEEGLKKLNTKVSDRVLFYIPDIDVFFNTIYTTNAINEILNRILNGGIKIITTLNVINFKLGVNSTFLELNKNLDENLIPVIKKEEQRFIIETIKEGYFPVLPHIKDEIFDGFLEYEIMPLKTIDVANILYQNADYFFKNINLNNVSNLFKKILLSTYIVEKIYSRNLIFKNSLRLFENYLYDKYKDNESFEAIDVEKDMINTLFYFINKIETIDKKIDKDLLFKIKTNLHNKIKNGDFGIDFVKNEDVLWETNYLFFEKFLKDYGYNYEINNWKQPIDGFRQIIEHYGNYAEKYTDMLVKLIRDLSPETDISKFEVTLKMRDGMLKGEVVKKNQAQEGNPLTDMLSKIIGSNGEINFVGTKDDIEKIFKSMGFSEGTENYKDIENNDDKTDYKEKKEFNKLDVEQKKEYVKNNIKKIQEKIKKIEILLKENILGQDSQIQEIINSIKNGFFNINNRPKPIASILLLGPTGVGKTETAKIIAKALHDPQKNKKNFLHINMTELMEGKHSVTRLTSAAPGYVGYGEGILVDFFIKDKVKEGVILFDEIEKAHPEVLNIFLQILDEGKITLSGKYEVDFSNFILIFTSNLGIRDLMQRNSMGLSAVKGNNEINVEFDELKNTILDELKKNLKPELVNRFDSKIVYNFITKDTASKILDQNIKEFNKHLKENYLTTITLTKSAKDFILNYGYERKYGVRNLQSSIKTNIVAKVIGYLMDNPDNIGNNLIIYEKNGNIKIRKGKNLIIESKKQNNNKKQETNIEFDFEGIAP